MVKLDFQLHHMTYPEGEEAEFKCPHCGKTLILVAKQLVEIDEDEVEIEVCVGE